MKFWKLCAVMSGVAMCAMGQEAQEADAPESTEVKPGATVTSKRRVADPQPDVVLLPRARATYSLRVGPTWNFRSKLSARWNPDAVRRAVSISFGHSSSRNAVPPATGYADRDYVDGYVHLDEGTIDPETMEYGTTWNWGYDSSSQYNGSTASFHTAKAGSSSSVSPVSASSAEESDEFDSLGIDFQGRVTLGDGGDDSTWGLAFGFRWFEDEEMDFAPSAPIARESSSSFRYVDVYDAHWEGFPSAPYAMDIVGPGYLLDNIPISRHKEPAGGSSSSWVARSRVRAELERWDLRLGPTLQWYAWRNRCIFEVQPQVLLARTELSVDVETTVTAGGSTKYHSVEHADEDDWLWGAGVEVSAAVGVSDTWTLSVAGAYDAWFDDPEVSVGPADVKAELGNWTLSCAIGKEF